MSFLAVFVGNYFFRDSAALAGHSLLSVEIS